MVESSFATLVLNHHIVCKLGYLGCYYLLLLVPVLLVLYLRCSILSPRPHPSILAFTFLQLLFFTHPSLHSSSHLPRIASLRACLVPNKSATHKSKSKKSDLFYQTYPTYKSPQLISHKLLHPNLKLISHPLLRVSHHLHDVDWCGKV